MASIFGSGIGCAALIAVCTISALCECPAQAQGSNSLDITIAGLRNSNGVVRLCIAPKGGAFPECKGPGSGSGQVAIVNNKASFRFNGLGNGDYAVAVFHDANRDGKLSTFLGIPREGYGFSNNPGFAPRAPRFDEARITISGHNAITIKLRYLM